MTGLPKDRLFTIFDSVTDPSFISMPARFPTIDIPAGSVPPSESLYPELFIIDAASTGLMFDPYTDAAIAAAVGPQPELYISRESYFD